MFIGELILIHLFSFQCLCGVNPSILLSVSIFIGVNSYSILNYYILFYSIYDFSIQCSFGVHPCTLLSVPMFIDIDA